MRNRDVIFKLGHVLRTWRVLRRVGVDFEVIRVGDVRAKRFELAQQLTVVHERATRVLDQRRSHIICDLSIVSLQCNVQVLRDALGAAGEHRLVLVGLRLFID